MHDSEQEHAEPAVAVPDTERPSALCMCGHDLQVHFSSYTPGGSGACDVVHCGCAQYRTAAVAELLALEPAPSEYAPDDTTPIAVRLVAQPIGYTEHGDAVYAPSPRAASVPVVYGIPLDDTARAALRWLDDNEPTIRAAGATLGDLRATVHALEATR